VNRVLIGCVGLWSLTAGCTSHPAVSTHDAVQRAPTVMSGAAPMLHFDGETVAQAAKTFNRYNRRKIVIDDPAIAAESS
jgi:ferric-dicitrate binding protein FerR (iron transport regulator)